MASREARTDFKACLRSIRPDDPLPVIAFTPEAEGDALLKGLALQDIHAGQCS